MTGLWTGQYWYPEPWEPPMGFVATISDNAGSLSGTTTEASDIFIGVDERADIRGTRSGTRVNFYKYYDGTGAYGHSVTYDGVLSPDGQQVEGQWSLDDYSGSFIMSRHLQRFSAEELEEGAQRDVPVS
ncbi:MAG: hypothetical protein Q7T68_15285 [Sphingopyxis sp.]|nr:hypothetical protein [Sphingopyxis sp.]